MEGVQLGISGLREDSFVAETWLFDLEITIFPPRLPRSPLIGGEPGQSATGRDSGGEMNWDEECEKVNILEVLKECKSALEEIRSVYEKHKGIGAVLSKEPTGYDLRGKALFDFWQAIKKVVEGK